MVEGSFPDSLNKCGLVNQVRENYIVWTCCLARLQGERLRQALETFPFHPLCARKTEHIPSNTDNTELELVVDL